MRCCNTERFVPPSVASARFRLPLTRPLKVSENVGPALSDDIFRAVSLSTVDEEQKIPEIESLAYQTVPS